MVSHLLGMPFSALCVAATTILLAMAAWSDLAIRVIPDRVSLALAAIGVVERGLLGLEALAWSAGIAVVLFIGLVLLHSRGLLGGGDVKLIAAVALGMSPAGVARFLVATSIVGASLVLLHLIGRRLPSPRRCSVGASRLRRVLIAERWRIQHRGSLPYGVAIAGGGAWVLLSGLGG